MESFIGMRELVKTCQQMKAHHSRWPPLIYGWLYGTALALSLLAALASSTAAARHVQNKEKHLNERAAALLLRADARHFSAANRRLKRSPLAPSMPLALLMPINELRVSGSKSEPPSRPSVDWSKQRPYFGPDMARNVSVELGKSAYLTCKVFELGDKTVSWLRPRENEILTAGRYTYIGDSRFASINDNGSHDWILEIKDVGLNDSTSYECQVSTDPKMSTIINLHVKAAKSRIKQGDQFYAPLGSNIEFSCDVGARVAPPGSSQQTYWYFNGNLLNYARTAQIVDKNFSIEWDSSNQLSRFRLFNLQASDAGNYTCKPTSAEPSTIRLHVKKNTNKGIKDRHHSNGYHSSNLRETQRNRQHYSADSVGVGIEASPESLNNSGSAQLAALISEWQLFLTLLLITFRLIH